MANFINTMKNIFAKSWVRWALGYVCVVFAGVMLVYYWRVVYSFAVISPFSATLLAVLALSVAYAAVFCTMKFAKSFALKGAILIFVAGLLFVFANPPLQAPDEHAHFFRAYSIGHGNFYYDQYEDYPNDADLLRSEFPPNYNFFHPVVGEQTVASGFVRYHTRLEGGIEAAIPATTNIQQTLPYLPQAAGIFIASLFKADALTTLYVARVANLLFYSFCCYLALKVAKRFRLMLFVFMITPISLFMAGSASSDAVINGLMWLFIAICLGEVTSTKRMAILAVCFGVLCAARMTNLLLLPLVLLLPFDAKNKKKFVYVATTCLVAMVGLTVLQNAQAAWFGNYGDIPYYHDAIQPANQIKFILQYPLRYILVFIGAFYKNMGTLFEGGLFGWLDANVTFASYFTPVLFMLAALLSARESKTLKKKEGILFSIIAVLFYGGIYTGMYVTSTGLQLPHINGVQMRYLLPALFCIFILVSALCAHIQPLQQKELSEEQVVKQSNIMLYSGFAFAVISAVLLVQLYYVGV